MTELEQMTKRLRQFVAARDWDKFHNPKDLSIQLTLEATEVMEHFLWKNDAEMEAHCVAHKDDIADELADVLNNVILLAIKLKIDLVAAHEHKMIKNEAKYPVEKSRGHAKKYTEL